MDKTILSADCLLYPKDKAAQAILTKQEITIHCDNGKEIISVADITGGWCMFSQRFLYCRCTAAN